MATPEIRLYTFFDDEVIPNHPIWPVLVYRGAGPEHPDSLGDVFRRNGWTNSWTGGVFDYHHYHSNTHEALGVIRGSAILQLGGEQGRKVELAAGDAVVLPAGTGHRCVEASPDFLVVGAYPNGMAYNLHTGKEGERPRVLEEIRGVPLPAADPLYGEGGPLRSSWLPAEIIG